MKMNIQIMLNFSGDWLNAAEWFPKVIQMINLKKSSALKVIKKIAFFNIDEFILITFHYININI